MNYCSEKLIEGYNINYCDKDLHTELRRCYAICPFCDILLSPPDEYVIEQCCENPYIDTEDYVRLCYSCGQVHCYELASEFVDFYENVYRVRRKSVYKRKYHIDNVFTELSINGVTIEYEHINKIRKVFGIFDKHIPKLDKKRGRLISIKYIIRQLLWMMGLMKGLG